MPWVVLVLLLTACTKPAPRPVSRSEPKTQQSESELAMLSTSPVIGDRARGVQLAEAKCAKGDPEGCTHFAWALLRGTHVDLDPARGGELLVRACKQKYQDACASAAFTNYDNTRLRDEMYDRGCLLGDAYSCTRLAEHQPERRGELQQRAFELEHAACERGKPTACVSAQIYAKDFQLKASVFSSTWNRALDQMKAACARGNDASLCASYASGLEHGHGGVPVDKNAALAANRRACDVGGTRACMLGGLAAKQAGDVEGGLGMLRRACELGESYGCFALVHSVPKEEALRAAMRGCELGEDLLCDGVLYHYEQQSNASGANATRRRLCGMGRYEHCVELAQAREQAGDIDEAQKLFHLACRYGDAWTGCSVELKRLQGGARDQRAAQLSAAKREVALFACCRDTKAATTPITAVLALGQSIDKKDVATFAAQIHPTRALQAEVVFGGKRKTFALATTTVDEAALRQLKSFHPNGLVCGDLVGDEARCTFTPPPYTRFRGVALEFTVARIGDRMYVVRIKEQVEQPPPSANGVVTP
jgi:TPR repeat protein